MKLIRCNEVFIIITVCEVIGFVTTFPRANKQVTLKESLKNYTESRTQRHNNNEENNNKDGEEKENILKTEAQKLLMHCDIERNSYSDNSNKYNATKDFTRRSSSQDRQNSYGHGNDGYSSNSWSNNKNGNPYSSGGNSEDGERNIFRSQNGNNQHGYDSDSNSANYGANNANTNSYSSNNMNHQTDFRSPSNVYGGMLRHKDQSNTEYGNNFNQNPMFDPNKYPQSTQFGAANQGFQASSSNDALDMRNSYGANSGFNRAGSSNNDCGDSFDKIRERNMFGYNTGMTFESRPPSLRHKRYNFGNRDDNEKNENNQCISQCVFDYLRLLDYDKTPSETLMIKWLQEHVTGNDMDRIKALRNARSCFTKLTTSDTDDGCELSTELSKCLELELE